SLDGSRARVSRSRPEYRRAPAAAGQRPVHEAREHLHREILEGEGRAVEQLKEVEVLPERHERRDFRGVVAGISLVDHLSQLIGREVRAGETPDDRLRLILIAQAAERGDLGFREAGPGLWD